MIKNFCRLSILLLALFQACQNKPSSTREIENKYENGQVSRRYTEINGKKEGKMTDYYNTGQLMAERWFVDDKQNGRTVIYFPGGALKEVQYYDNGVRQAGDTIWYEDGKVQFIAQMKDNKKNGYLRKWDSIGNMVFEAKYAMDTLVEVKGKAVR